MLQESPYPYKFLSRIAWALYAFHRTKRIKYFSMLCAFLYKNSVRIQHSLQYQAFRVGVDNDKNDLIWKDEIK